VNVIESAGIGIGLAARPLALAAGDELGDALDDSEPEPQEATNSRRTLAINGDRVFIKPPTTFGRHLS
jgi:hypothetical protein